MENQNYESTIEAIFKCAVACNNCESACLIEEDVRMMVHCIALNHDCAAMCYLLAEYMASESPFAEDLATLCANICDSCAKECAKHEYEHCQKCAEACRNCAEACRSYEKVES